MKTFKTVLGAAAFVALLAAPAFAADNDQTGTNNQSTTNAIGITLGDQSAWITNNVIKNAKGRIGINVSTGVGNQQSNQLLIGSGNGSSSLDNDQKTDTVGTGSLAGVIIPGVLYVGASSAYVNGNVGQHVSGDVGVNVAAGALNQQANATAVRDACDTCKPGDATANSDQSTNKFIGVTLGHMSAYASGNAFAGASGNIGVNITNGVGNQQSNQLVLQH